MPDRSPYADAAPLLATPLDEITAPVTTIAKSEGHLVAGLSYDDAQLERRRATLGASEIPAVVGLDPHRSPLDIYLLKRGIKRASYEHSAQEWGLRLEAVIAEKYAELHPDVVVKTMAPQVHVAEPWMSATPDRLCLSTDGEWLLEIKNKSAPQKSKWGDSGTDEVPFEIIAQATWQLMVTKLERCDIAVLFGGNEFRIYTIRRDDAVANRLYEDGHRFWTQHVLMGVPPAIDGSEASAEYLKKRFAQITEVVREATDQEARWIKELGEKKGRQKELEGYIALLENQLKQAIGADAGLHCRHGRVTWKQPQDSTVIDFQAVANLLRSYVPAEVFGNAVKSHTTTRQNSRRFVPRFEGSV